MANTVGKTVLTKGLERAAAEWGKSVSAGQLAGAAQEVPMPADLSPEEIASSHRWHAVECNNLAWSLSAQPERTLLEDEEMLNAAHASAYHWGEVGTQLHRARAKMLLGHVHAALGHGQTALAYSQESYEYLTAHSPPDWEIAFAHAILAHAAIAAGDIGLHQQHYAKALELGQVIADPEDKEIFFETFNRIPRR